MGFINNLLTFVSGMHISAIVIIGIILLIFFLSCVFSIALRAKFSKLQRELDRQSVTARGASRAPAGQEGSPAFDRFSEPRFRSLFLRGVLSDFELSFAAQKGVGVNTQAIIENYINRKMKASIIQERFCRNSVSMMIVLGLLGTFIGLTLSVQSLVLLFQGYDVTELLSSVESGLLSALVGMSAAFTTSLFGIACSVVITVINVFLNPGMAREALMVGLEDYLDGTVSARLRAEAGDGADRMNDALHKTFVEFGEKIAERFDRALLTMRDDVRGIEEANNNLRNTIEQMDVSFVRIADALKSSTRHVEDNYQALTGLTERLQETSDGFENIRRENERYSANLVKSVTEASAAIGGLTGDLRGEAQRRLDNFSSYDAAISTMARSAELIRDAVAAIPEQMYAYGEASRAPSLSSGALREAAAELRAHGGTPGVAAPNSGGKPDGKMPEGDMPDDDIPDDSGWSRSE